MDKENVDRDSDQVKSDNEADAHQLKKVGSDSRSRSHTWPCRFCSASFSSELRLILHFREMHYNPEDEDSLSENDSDPEEIESKAEEDSDINASTLDFLTDCERALLKEAVLDPCPESEEEVNGQANEPNEPTEISPVVRIGHTKKSKMPKPSSKSSTIDKPMTSKGRPKIMLPRKCKELPKSPPPDTSRDKQQRTRILLPRLGIKAEKGAKQETMAEVKPVHSHKVTIRKSQVPSKSSKVKTPDQEEDSRKRCRSRRQPPSSKNTKTQSIPIKSVDNPKKDPHRRNKGLSDCIFCDKSYYMPYLLEDHIRSHIGERGYFCKLCDDSFTSNRCLKVHVRLVHSKVLYFTCKFCAEVFSTLTGLKNHMTSHSADREFECEHCEMRFYTQKDLTRHMNIHNGKGSHQCEHCKKEFARSDNLRKHMKNVHNIVPPPIKRTRTKKTD